MVGEGQQWGAGCVLRLDPESVSEIIVLSPFVNLGICVLCTFLLVSYYI